MLGNALLVGGNPKVAEQIVTHDPADAFVDVDATGVILVGPAAGELEEALFDAAVDRTDEVVVG